MKLKLDFEAATQLMDDDLREQVHAELAPCEPESFLSRYQELHQDRYGAAFGPCSLEDFPGYASSDFDDEGNILPEPRVITAGVR